MSEVDRILGEYIEQHQAGANPNPWAFIDRLQGPEREELEELIDAYLLDAPPRPWDAEAFKGSREERLTEELDRSLRGVAGVWPLVLPRLRNRAQLKRKELVERLAAALGAGEKEEKVAGYYHEMEQGLLPARGVSSRVLEALGEIVGETAERLRGAGEAVGGGGGAERGDAVFARSVKVEELRTIDADRTPEAPQATPGEWDEVDELFRGGP
jgi:hypothetical protein